MALDDHMFEVHFLQQKLDKTILFSSPNFILNKYRGLLESFTPSIIAKENASNKIIHMPPT
jgi:hypothetical protein